MSCEAAIAGEGFRLLLRVTGYAHPGFESGSDANWLTGEAESTASSTGSFSGRHAVPFRTEELADFRDQLAQLVEDLDGSAKLQCLEGQVGCTITSGAAPARSRDLCVSMSERKSASAACELTSPISRTPYEPSKLLCGSFR